MPTSSTNQLNTGTQSTSSTGTSTSSIADPTATTAKNLANIPGLASLTGLINAINQQSQQQANIGRIPGEAGLEQQSSRNISDALRGQVSGSTKALLGQETAEAGIGSGMASDAAYLRLLGQTSEGLQGTGQSWLTAATARNPAAATYDPTTGLLTAAQGDRTTTSTNDSTTGNVNRASSDTTQSEATAGAGGPNTKTSSGLGDSLSSLLGRGTSTGTTITPTDFDSTAGLNQNTNPWADLGFSDLEYNTLFNPGAHTQSPLEEGTPPSQQQDQSGADVFTDYQVSGAPTGGNYNPYTDTVDYAGG